jgi:H+/Cl- antiporter ClcA
MGFFDVMLTFDYPSRKPQKNMLEFLLRLRKRLKNLFDKISNERVKINLLQAVPFWVASIITGLVAVFYTKLFSWAEKESRVIFEYNHWFFLAITPVCFIFSWWVIRRFATYARGSGIPQVMASIELTSSKNVHLIKKLLSLKIIFFKILSSVVMVFGGGAVGREGPTIQIAGSVFKQIYDWLPKWWPRISQRNMIMTGSAAGLAAAFNTPLGGIVFAVEELARTHINYFKTAIFTAVIIAGLTAQGLLGPYLYLGYPEINGLPGYIFFIVALVAVVTGLLGSVMAKIMVQLLKWKSKFRFHYQHFLYLIIGAFIITGLAIFINRTVMGSGSSLMTSVLFSEEKYSAWHIPLLRIIGPVLSFTTGAAGGVFAPALSAGAGVGSTMAGWFDLSTGGANLLILAGMVGFLTGVTRTPFTSAILVLEMTDRHNVIFHLLLAAMLASLSAMLVDRRSFYDHLKRQYIRELNEEEKMISAGQNEKPESN